MKSKVNRTSGRAFRRRPAARSRAPRIRSILVPTDFSEPSFEAVRYAAMLGRQFGAKLALLYVLEPVSLPEFGVVPLAIENAEVVRSAQAQLNALPGKQRLDPELVTAAIVREGSPHAGILATARKLKSDLIVIATHGRKGLAHALLGSTTERVVRHAPCPVLVVRRP